MFFLFLCIYLFTDSLIAGKTMENLRNRRTVDLVTSEKKLKKLSAQTSIKQFKIFHENLVAVEQVKVKLTLNQPIYVGFTILDLSKTLMYDFHYSYIKKKYPDSTLLFTDTDFLTYQIQTDNVYEDVYADKQLFNFSGYEKESPFYDDENKKVIGKMKDELSGEIIVEFVDLRAKMCCLKTKNEEMKKAKRVKKNIVKKDISHLDYVDYLFEERKFMHTMQSVRSFKHQLYTIKQNKSPLALTMVNNTCWMMGLALFHTVILDCCECLKNFSIIFFRNFYNIFYLLRNLK